MKTQEIPENNSSKNNREKEFFFISLFIVILLISSFFLFFNKNRCGDGTLEGNCSNVKPYFCEKKILVKNPILCGCPDTLELNGEECTSEYFTKSKKITLNYVLRGEKKEMNFVVYGGFVDFLSSFNKFSEGTSRKELKLEIINNVQQRDLLLPLVIKIQNEAVNKKDQVRIAISLVQNIPYGSSEKEVIVGYNKVSYRRYPYEVLYDLEGVCDEKSELLVFLLKELGYETALIYYPYENHEVVGIKCPIENSLENTGYCFIEPSGPSILSDYNQEYSGGLELSSDFELISMSNGTSLDESYYEFEDAKNWRKLNQILKEKGELNFFRYYKWNNLKEKYGLLV